MKRRHDPRNGQAIVVLALSITVLLAATAVVIDGGNAMAQQRGTQTATDSAVYAGAVVIAEKMAGASRVDADVLSAMTGAFANNASAMGTARYVDYDGNIAGTVGRGGSIPSSAAGIEATGSRTFETFLASILGHDTWTAGAGATAIAGALRSVCSAADGCGVLPVAFSIPITACDGTGRPLRIGVDWALVSLATARADSAGVYESIVPLCLNGPGGVGWLDLACGGNLGDQIDQPCNKAIDIPVWIRSTTGDVNSVEGALENYLGEPVLLPMFDATCRDVPSTGLPADCTDAGNGLNLWYHIPRFTRFLLDEVHIQGGDHPACNSGPGQPPVGGNGSIGCLKGWFVRYIMQGRVSGFEACGTGAEDDDAELGDCLEEPIIGVQLIR